MFGVVVNQPTEIIPTNVNDWIQDTILAQLWSY